MAREFQRDLKSLLEFFESYSLSGLNWNQELRLVIAQQHKKYFSFLTFIAELESQKSAMITPSLSNVQREYLTEACSDIGNSIFVMTHGAYKAARMMLRSSIETFFKGFNCDEIPNILSEKSLFAIFEAIQALEFFQEDSMKRIFESLHSDYKELCKDIHTASRANMVNLTALEYFPRFDTDAAISISRISTRLVSNYLILLCFKYKGYFFNMHYRNSENILTAVPRLYRPIIQGVHK